MSRHTTLFDEIASSTTPLAETLRGMPQKDVAEVCRRAGMSWALMKLYVCGAPPAGWIERRIANAIGKPREFLFPSQQRPPATTQTQA